MTTPVQCTYGMCTAEASFHLTRSNVLGTGEATVCPEHLAPMTAHLARYVPGWGKVTFTADRLPEVTA